MPVNWAKIKKADMVRINTRISKAANQWLDNQVDVTGVPKSTWVYLALEQFIQQKQAIDSIEKLAEKLDLIQKIIEEGRNKP